MPFSPPVSSPPDLAISTEIITKPSVAMARNTSSSRSTGSASSTPTTVAIAAAMSIDSTSGTPKCVVRMALP